MHYYFLDNHDHETGKAWAVLTEERFFKGGQMMPFVETICYTEFSKEAYIRAGKTVIEGVVTTEITFNNDGTVGCAELIFKLLRKLPRQKRRGKGKRKPGLYLVK